MSSSLSSYAAIITHMMLPVLVLETIAYRNNSIEGNPSNLYGRLQPVEFINVNLLFQIKRPLKHGYQVPDFKIHLKTYLAYHSSVYFFY